MQDVPDHLESVLTALRQFVRERDWEQFHNPKNLAMCLGSEVGELLAEYRWVPTDRLENWASEDPSRNRIALELGDVGIAWLLLCDRLGLDPLGLVEAKLEMNRAKYPIDATRGRPDRP